MSLVHWWPLRGDTVDIITGTNATSSGVIQVDGKIGKAYSFNASNGSTIYTSYNQTLNPSEFSFAFWIKLDSSWSGWGQVFTIGNKGTSWTDIRIGCDISGDKVAYFSVSNGSSAVGGGGPRHTLFAEKWYHIACTYENKKMSMYVNGENTNTTTVTSTYDPLLTTASIISSGGNSSEIGECVMNDVRIYSHALSKAEVKELSKGLVVHYTFNDTLAEPTTNLLPTSLQNKYVENDPDAASYTITSGLTASAYTLSANIKRHIGDQSPSPYVSLFVTYSDGTSENITTTTAVDGYDIRGTADGQFHHYILTIFNTSKKTVTKVSGWILDRGSYTSGTPRYMTIENAQLEAKDHATPYTPGKREPLISNNTGYLQDGTSINTSLTKDSIYGSYSMKFNGSGTSTQSYIDLGDVTLNTHNISFCVWCKWNSLQNWSRIFDFGRSTDGQDTDILIANSSTSATLYFAGRAKPGSTISSLDQAIGTVSVGDWYFISAVIDNTNLTTYIYKEDGTLQKHVGTIPELGDSVTFVNSYLGKSNWSADSYFDGQIADFRIYSTSLSENDVKDLYQTKAMISDKGDIMSYQFVEGKSQAQVTTKANFEAKEFYEEIDAGYERLEYIESTNGGGQYINTGISGSTVIRKLETYHYLTTSNASQILFGNNQYYLFYREWDDSRSNYGVYLPNSGYVQTSIKMSPGYTYTYLDINADGTLKFSVEKSTDTTYENEVKTGTHSNTFNNGYNHYLFAYNNNGPAGYYVACRMYMFRVYGENNILIRDFIPTRRKSDNVLGLFDNVNKVFYTNAGTGTFTAGPVVTNTNASIYNTHVVSGRNLKEI